MSSTESTIVEPAFIAWMTAVVEAPALTRDERRRRLFALWCLAGVRMFGNRRLPLAAQIERVKQAVVVAIAFDDKGPFSAAASKGGLSEAVLRRLMRSHGLYAIWRQSGSVPFTAIADAVLYAASQHTVKKRKSL